LPSAVLVLGVCKAILILLSPGFDYRLVLFDFAGRSLATLLSGGCLDAALKCFFASLNWCLLVTIVLNSVKRTAGGIKKNFWLMAQLALSATNLNQS
jgi:hypothetical protein